MSLGCPPSTWTEQPLFSPASTAALASLVLIRQRSPKFEPLLSRLLWTGYTALCCSVVDPASRQLPESWDRIVERSETAEPTGAVCTVLRLSQALCVLWQLIRAALSTERSSCHSTDDGCDRDTFIYTSYMRSCYMAQYGQRPYGCYIVLVVHHSNTTHAWRLVISWLLVFVVAKSLFTGF